MNHANGSTGTTPDNALAIFSDIDEIVADLSDDELPFMHELYDWLHKQIYGTNI